MRASGPTWACDLQAPAKLEIRYELFRIADSFTPVIPAKLVPYSIREPVSRQSGASYPSGFRLAGRNDSFSGRSRDSYTLPTQWAVVNLVLNVLRPKRWHG